MLLIINPLEPKFRYADHLQFMQVSTEALSFTKYTRKSERGRKTYEDLRFDLLERAQALNSVDGLAADLNERLSRAVSATLSEPEGEELLKLLSDLSSAIYRRPTPA